QARQDRLRLRITDTLKLYQRRGIGAAESASSGVGLPVLAEGLGPMSASAFGFDPALEDHYPVRWWIALTATLIIAIVGAKLGSELGGNLVWLGLPVGWIVLSRTFFSWCESRRRDKLFTQFPDALAMIVRAVRVGIPVSDSIRAVGQELEAPTGPEFTRLSRELSIGMVLPEALKAMAERNGLQEYRFFATALSLQNQTGGGLSETLENLADVIRKRVATRQKGHALAAEAKMSSLVLAGLPPFAGVGLWIMNSKYIVLLFVDPMGQKILGAAVLLLTAGIVAMNVLIRKSLS
ncbi:MAG TPA: type II secretion system F family protein, partial [Rhodopila sp.]